MHAASVLIGADTWFLPPSKSVGAAGRRVNRRPLCLCTQTAWRKGEGMTKGSFRKGGGVCHHRRPEANHRGLWPSREASRRHRWPPTPVLSVRQPWRQSPPTDADWLPLDLNTNPTSLPAAGAATTTPLLHLHVVGELCVRSPICRATRCRSLTTRPCWRADRLPYAHAP